MKIFVAYPFSAPPLPDYRDAINAVMFKLKKFGADVSLDVADGDFRYRNAHILAEIEDLIGQSDAVICDISSLNPNVMFELGIARGRNKSVEICVKTPLVPDAIPADLQGLQRRTYSNRSEFEKLLEDLVMSYVREAPSEADESVPEALREQVSNIKDAVFDLIEADDSGLYLSEVVEQSEMEPQMLTAVLSLLIEDGKVEKSGEPGQIIYSAVEAEDLEE